MIHATVVSDFTSHGKESEGFYDNIDKIIKWKHKYKFSKDVEELFDTLNYCGEASTYYPDRAFYVAYVLCREGYETNIKVKELKNNGSRMEMPKM